MNGLSHDPGLRQAFTQQTNQRLLAESTHARVAKNLALKDKERYEIKQFTLRSKIKTIALVVQDAASIIFSIMRASSHSANA